MNQSTLRLQPTKPALSTRRARIVRRMQHTIDASTLTSTRPRRMAGRKVH